MGDLGKAAIPALAAAHCCARIAANTPGQSLGTTTTGPGGGAGGWAVSTSCGSVSGASGSSGGVVGWSAARRDARTTGRINGLPP